MKSLDIYCRGFFTFTLMESQLFSPFYSSSGVCTDTRTIQKNCLFVCIRGENFDGNTFAREALKQGAHHVIVDNADFYDSNLAMTLVADSVLYLQSLALHHRRKFDIPVIGITGSNGKTSTKELINAVLSEKYQVLATQGNLNNHLGVPLTLLRLTDAHEIAIIEMGANKFKDIEELCTIAEPNYGIITNIGKAHLEGFLSFEGVLKTKRELYTAVEKAGGTLVVNNDDPILTNILPQSLRLITYGTQDADVVGKLIGLNPFVEMTWETNKFKSEVLGTQMVGKYNFYNYLAAIAFGQLFDVPHDQISKAISSYVPSNKRSQVQKSAHNILILDCYNANPTSMSLALESFAIMSNPMKFVIIGDMKELGSESHEEHEKIIRLLEQLGLQGITVGSQFASIKSPAISQQFDTAEQALAHFQSHPVKDSLILLKGSRSIRLETLESVL